MKLLDLPSLPLSRFEREDGGVFGDGSVEVVDHDVLKLVEQRVPLDSQRVARVEPHHCESTAIVVPRAHASVYGLVIVRDHVDLHAETWKLHAVRDAEGANPHS